MDLENRRPAGRRLSDVAKAYPIEVVRDAEFYYTGKIPTALPGKIVPIGAARYLDELNAASGVTAAITTAELAPQIDGPIGIAVCEKPMEVFFRLHAGLCKEGYFWGAPEKTSIGENVSIHPTAKVAENDVFIGDNARIEENAVIRPYSIIGADSLIGPSTVVSCEGFQTASIDGRQILLPQSGGVKIGQAVSVLALSTITRATFGGFTTIGDEAVIDNLTQIAHDVVIGRRTRIAAGAIISGRVQIGENVYVAPNATISNGVEIGAGATITIGSVVITNVPANQTVTGNFAVKHRKFMKDLAKRFML